MSRSQPYTVRVAGELRARIEARAVAENCPPSDIVRRAIERFLDDVKLLDDSRRRHLRTTEYMQLAIDTMIRENHPELREALIAEADRRMKIHHGA